ncbi:cupin domain-containing protein [Phocaeicola plebeius]|jgi:mannose-6-phosphate isomerase-like protein (cupin superfamily)|uniref:Cupin domain-containing protein n=1 Tax=Phocaeicola plebeius TaxID=310297 RepID=A0A3E4N3D8_9BACT|nr:cupin domain-containing protein [Phocaeicola plebeius]MBS4811312.1 cupin domain-containing protein [Bacteroides sp.]MBS4826027.1 cupin domain-containing protein [Bacteroides sp.]MCI6050497.1 cupin domain-containing protein [Phocaeicola plebeius]MDD6913871.1 cupin domain-containing protein [Phocaeicola plebeius]MDY5977083.1 cupin domain-containing protein [Phocaeicola plebeius]
MKQTQQIAEGTHFSALSTGSFSQLNDYVLPVAPGMEIQGKVFMGQTLQTTGAEISFQSFAPGKETGFLHTHQTHEELYIFVSGKGEFQVDGQVFPVGEGSVVRVAPEGKRSVRNNGTEPLIMICVQYKAQTFTAQDAADGQLLQEPVKW